MILTRVATCPTTTTTTRIATRSSQGTHRDEGQYNTMTSHHSPIDAAAKMATATATSLALTITAGTCAAPAVMSPTYGADEVIEVHRVVGWSI